MLAALSERYAAVVSRLVEHHDGERRPVAGRLAPSRIDELVLYQNLLGAWPLDASEEDGFSERILAYMAKAAHEEKLRTSWTDPDEEYEAELARFATRAIATFRGSEIPDLPELREAVAWYGAIDGLAQALLRFAAPGVPDVYQGCELWNLSLVDPDNRRPVDYELRARLLERLEIDRPPTRAIAAEALRGVARRPHQAARDRTRAAPASPPPRAVRSRRLPGAERDGPAGPQRDRLRAPPRGTVGDRRGAAAPFGARRRRHATDRRRRLERDGGRATRGRAGRGRERAHGRDDPGNRRGLPLAETLATLPVALLASR